jgi:hypothetical protein
MNAMKSDGGKSDRGKSDWGTLAWGGLGMRRWDPEGDRGVAALIVQLVAVATGVEVIAAPSRNCAHAARARQMAMYLAHTVCAWPLARVGLAFGRDRSTASYAVRKIEDFRDDAVFDAVLTQLEACISVAPLERGMKAPGA